MKKINSTTGHLTKTKHSSNRTFKHSSNEHFNYKLTIYMYIFTGGKKLN